jgi:signal transduction histidine kinase
MARRERVLDDEARWSASVDIYHEASRLNRIVDDLLTLARLEGGKLEGEPLAFEHIMEDMVRDFARNSSREIVLKSDGGRTIIFGDENLLSHVMRNYLSNAEKYSPPGTPIEVMLGTGTDCATVRVLDRGIGINVDDPQQLFEPFYRGENVGPAAGIGIGLSVCQRLVEAIGGRVWALPREGGGSEFGFQLERYDEPDVT